MQIAFSQLDQMSSLVWFARKLRGQRRRRRAADLGKNPSCFFEEGGSDFVLRPLDAVVVVNGELRVAHEDLLASVPVKGDAHGTHSAEGALNRKVCFLLLELTEAPLHFAAVTHRVVRVDTVCGGSEHAWQVRKVIVLGRSLFWSYRHWPVRKMVSSSHKIRSPLC